MPGGVEELNDIICEVKRDLVFFEYLIGCLRWNQDGDVRYESDADLIDASVALVEYLSSLDGIELLESRARGDAAVRIKFNKKLVHDVIRELIANGDKGSPFSFSHLLSGGVNLNCAPRGHPERIVALFR